MASRNRRYNSFHELKINITEPTIAFAQVDDGQEIKGSARSIKGFHIRDALDIVATKNPGLIDKFGGHAMAAGLSLKNKILNSSKEAF